MLILTKDVVIWDAHPLTIGATPVQVFIDGIAQIDDPYTVQKSWALQRVPSVPKWDCEAAQTVKWDGLPPLQGRKYSLGRGVAVRFERVKSAWISNANGTIVNVFGEDYDNVAEASKYSVSHKVLSFGFVLIARVLGWHTVMELLRLSLLPLERGSCVDCPLHSIPDHPMCWREVLWSKRKRPCTSPSTRLSMLASVRKLRH